MNWMGPYEEDLSGNRKSGTEQRHKALTASFIYISQDQTGKPMAAPPLLITTEEGERLFEEGRKRYEARENQRSFE